MDFIPFTFIDFIDIFFVALIMFGLYRMTRGTNAPYIVSGIIVIYIVWVVVRALNMELLSSILGQIVSVGVLAIIIVFQPELRHFLQMIGMRRKGFNFINRIFNTHDFTGPNLTPIISACTDMSESKTGALIVLAQESDLRDIIDGGQPYRRSQVHTARDTVERPQIVRHAPPRRHRHNRDVGCHCRSGIGGDGRHIGRIRRQDRTQHRPAQPCTGDITTLCQCRQQQ